MSVKPGQLHLDRIASYAAYDNTTKTDSATYHYDVLDRLRFEKESHQQPGGSFKHKATTFDYIGLTDQVATEKIDNNSIADGLITTKTYGYDALGRLETMTNSPNGSANAETGKAGTFYYSFDVHGNVSQLLDQDGDSVQASYSYTPYGAPDPELTDEAMPAGATADEDYPLNAYRYTADRLDTGSGTLDMGFRRFSPDTARFLTPDYFQGAVANLGLSSDPLMGNRYAFGSANPVSFIEWDGHVLDWDVSSERDAGKTPAPVGGGAGCDNCASIDGWAGSNQVHPASQRRWNRMVNTGAAQTGERLQPQCYTTPETERALRSAFYQCFQTNPTFLATSNEYRYKQLVGDFFGDYEPSHLRAAVLRLAERSVRCVGHPVHTACVASYYGTVSVTGCAAVCVSAVESRSGGRHRAGIGVSISPSIGGSISLTPGREAQDADMIGLTICRVLCFGGAQTQSGDESWNFGLGFGQTSKGTRLPLIKGRVGRQWVWDIGPSE